MDFLTFVFFYLICSIVLFSIVGFVIWIIIRHKAVEIAKTNEELLDKVLERL